MMDGEQLPVGLLRRVDGALTIMALDPEDVPEDTKVLAASTVAPALLFHVAASVASAVRVPLPWWPGNWMLVDERAAVAAFEDAVQRAEAVLHGPSDLLRDPSAYVWSVVGSFEGSTPPRLPFARQAYDIAFMHGLALSAPVQVMSDGRCVVWLLVPSSDHAEPVKDENGKLVPLPVAAVAKKLASLSSRPWTCLLDETGSLQHHAGAKLRRQNTAFLTALDVALMPLRDADAQLFPPQVPDGGSLGYHFPMAVRSGTLDLLVIAGNQPGKQEGGSPRLVAPEEASDQGAFFALVARTDGKRARVFSRASDVLAKAAQDVARQMRR